MELKEAEEEYTGGNNNNNNNNMNVNMNARGFQNYPKTSIVNKRKEEPRVTLKMKTLRPF